MNTLPQVLANLIAAQNNFDSIAYSNCFADAAIVSDEGKTHKGRKEIKAWIEAANNAYKTVMHPIEYFSENQQLKAEISGTFPGSPLVLTYQFDIQDEQIHKLKIV